MTGELNNKPTPNKVPEHTKLITEYWRAIANKKKLEDKHWWKLFYAHHRQIFYLSYALSKCANWEYKGQSVFTDAHITINVELALPLLKQLWLTGSTLIVQGNLQRFNGEYHLLQAQNEAKVCAEFLEGTDENYSNWFDMTETIAIDALSNNQINITCVNGLCSLVNASFKDLCNIDDI